MVKILNHCHEVGNEYYLCVLDGEFTLLQEQHFTKSLALDVVFHMFPQDGSNTSDNVVMAVGMDNGSVNLHSVTQRDNNLEFVVACTLSKHEDWVRCISFVTLGIELLFLK